MKKVFSTLAAAVLIVTGLVACSNDKEGTIPETPNNNSEMTSVTKVGMVTDSGTIDDKSFNQGTWEGILRYAEDTGAIEYKYIQPNGETTEDYMSAIDNLVLAGNEIIVSPGYKFEETIGQAQIQYPDVKFILIDGTPIVGEDEDGNPIYEVAENTVSVFFTEHEAGFLAGIASALQSETGKVGFLGGMKVPAVEKLGWGFLAGIAYANNNLGTSTEIIEYIYQGTFTDVVSGKTIAGGMYDKGVDIIFAAGGAVGSGAISGAKERKESGESVYIAGVDVDQYNEGITSDGSSIILTSAMKRIDNAAYDHIDLALKNEFKGGEIILMNAKSNGVGLPIENPNLTPETIKVIEEIFTLIQDDNITVPSTVDEVSDYLDEMELKVAFEY